MVVNNMLRSGWKRGHIRDGFVNMFRRDNDKNYICPDYVDATVFPNGRIADGHYRKYPRRRS
jgi:hypothetical protein